MNSRLAFPRYRVLDSAVTAPVALAAVLATAAIAAPANSEQDSSPLKVVAFGWEFSRKSLTDLPSVVESLDAMPIDGIGVYLNERQSDGSRLSTHSIMHEPWRRETLEPLVPLARSLTAHRSMRESFIGTFRSPWNKRIEWNDDAGWSRVASNMSIAAWFAREGGFRGISMDPEDYSGSAQFVRRDGDAPYEQLCAIARERGREVFSGVFAEYPDITILSFWFLSMDHRYLGSDNPARDARVREDLWPSFVDGILDVIPSSARILDGSEHSYRYESASGDFYRVGHAIRRRLPSLLSPENRAIYAAQVGVSFGLYLDMLTNPEDSNWYSGPVDGSRVRHFEHNLDQAADAADGYIWLWGEKYPWGEWGPAGPDAKRGISPETWAATLPRLCDSILAVKNPTAYAAKREAELRAEGRWTALTSNPGCTPDELDSGMEYAAVPAPYSTWQHAKARQGRLYCDTGAGDGDSACLAAEGAENGAFTLEFPGEPREGDRYLVTVSMQGDGGSASFCWKRSDGAWDWDVLSPVQLCFGRPDARGWRRARAIIRIPQGSPRCGLILSLKQNPGQICRFDNIAIYPLD